MVLPLAGSPLGLGAILALVLFLFHVWLAAHPSSPENQVLSEW